VVPAENSQGSLDGNLAGGFGTLEFYTLSEKNIVNILSKWIFMASSKDALE